ncbi:MAG: hypothetical protein Q8K75_10365 [Chlamydiales bacterium]|nr:hypothetical protein [Chlamydiales bacterium]
MSTFKCVALTKYLLFSILPICGYSIEHTIVFENQSICLSKFKLDPRETTGFHRDEYPHIVIAIQGGTIKRFEPDGTSSEIPLPTGEAVFRPIDPYLEGHNSVNLSDDVLEAYIIQIKNSSL